MWRSQMLLAKSFILSKGNYKSKKIEIDESKGSLEIESVNPQIALYDISIIDEIDKIKRMIKNAPIK